MAKLIRGQIEGGGLYASDFLRFCPIIASLSREEVIFVATLYRHTVEFKPIGTSDVPPHGTDEKMQEALIPSIYPGKVELDGAATALLRTGLLVLYSGYGGLVFRPTPLLFQIAKMADFEAALDAEPNDRHG